VPAKPAGWRSVIPAQAGIQLTLLAGAIGGPFVAALLPQTGRPVQVIFAAFIYAPNISFFGCVFVQQYAIDFVQFHGRELRQPELIDWRERHSFHRDYVRALQQLLRETGGQARESESIDSTSAIRMCVQELVDLLSDSWECARESANNVILHAASHFREILSGET
jgi:hypothetical protein